MLASSSVSIASALVLVPPALNNLYLQIRFLLFLKLSLIRKQKRERFLILKPKKKNEEMNYQETVRVVRAFLGFTHIPDFEASISDYDRSDNPWKGKHPRKSGKVSVEIPANDWLCHKMEKLNTRAAEGYPSRSQKSAGLKQDQFIRTPKSHSKWYSQSYLRLEDPQHPERSIFSWSPRGKGLLLSTVGYIGALACPVEWALMLGKVRTCGLLYNQPCRRIQQVYQRDTGENGGAHYLNVIVKGKAPKEVTDVIKELKDLSAFHTSISVALGTSLQHLTDSLFVQLANFVILRRDSYLDYVKAGVEPDTWNRLRNAPLFSSSLFPDDVLAIAEKDIIKLETNPGAPGPGSGTQQHHGRRTQFRYKPYEKESRHTGYGSSQSQQSWRQFSQQSRGRGRRSSSSPYFTKTSRGAKPYK